MATLYKYKPWNKFTKEILEKGELYFPSVKQLNDPYEGFVPYKFEESELTPDKIFDVMYKIAKDQHPDLEEEKLQEFVYENQKDDLLHNAEHLRKQSEKMRDELDSRYGIMSLTSKRDDFLMWSYYTDSHKGICIGFDIDRLQEKVQGIFGKVTYASQVPILHLSDLMDPIKFYERSLSTKSHIWSHEDEYRLAKSGKAKSKVYIDLDVIKEVILGYNMDFEERSKIIELIKAKNEECLIFETSLNKSEFKLDVNQIY